MKFFSTPNAAAKPRVPPPEPLPKDAITLSGGKPDEAFLESALGLLSSQQPVWIPSPEEMLEINQQQAMASMMAAIRHSEEPDETRAERQIQALTEEHILATIQALTQAPAPRVPIHVTIEKDFVNIDSDDTADGDQRVTLGVASRAIFAKSATSAKKFNIPVACFVASIKEQTLGIVFHCTPDGTKSIPIELGSVEECRLTKPHLTLLTKQFGMHEQQVRVFAGTIALQGAAYSRAITAALVQEISDLYEIDHEGIMRLAISLEKWRVLHLQRNNSLQ